VNEAFDGGAGLDTLTCKGKLANFSFSKTTTGITLKDNSGANGTDTLKNIEKIQFDDVSINLTLQAKAATIPVADLKTIEELYIGFFNRIPDADGLSYWIDQYKGGETVKQIADDFYTAGVQYSTSTGYSNAMTNDDFIKIIYANVLERSGLTAPNATEISFWSNQLTDGTQTRGSIVTAILNTVHTEYANDPQWGWVGKLLDNKVAVAHKVAVEWGLTYPTPEASIAKGVDIVNAVTVNDTTAAIHLVGVSAVFA
jgi:serralysin